MTLPTILLPVFVQVGLIFALGILLGRRRYAAVQAGQVERSKVLMGERNWPRAAQAASNAFSHQFEAPMLFFAIVPLAILTRKADLLFVVLSWVFVLSRIAHAAVYVTTNHLPYRLGAYAVGMAALFIMWVVLAVRVLLSPLPA